MDYLLTTRQAANHLGLKIQTLECWRVNGINLPYIKHKKIVRYRKQDLIEWVESKMVVPK